MLTNFIPSIHNDSLARRLLYLAQNELGDDFNEIFGGIQQETEPRENSRPYKIIEPDPGK